MDANFSSFQYLTAHFEMYVGQYPVTKSYFMENGSNYSSFQVKNTLTRTIAAVCRDEDGAVSDSLLMSCCTLVVKQRTKASPSQLKQVIPIC